MTRYAACNHSTAPTCCGEPMRPARRVGHRCPTCRSWVSPNGHRVDVPPCPDCGEPMWSLAWRREVDPPRRKWACRNDRCCRRTWDEPAAEERA